MKNSNDLGWIFETITTHTLDVIAIIDQNRKVRFTTSSFFEISGYSPDDLATLDVFDRVHPDDRDWLMERHRRVIKTQQKSSSEYRVFDKWGNVRHWECKTTPLPNTEDNLTVVAIRDITERKEMENKLQHRKERYKILQQSLNDYAQSLSNIMNITELENILLHEISKILPESGPSIENFKGEQTSNPFPFRVGDIETVENQVLIKIGERTDCHYILSLNADAISEQMNFIWLKTLIAFTGMVLENLNVIEELNAQLESVIENNETPQWVLRLLFNLQEQQRFNLSSDLHDTVLQEQIDLYRRLESLLNRYEMEIEMKTKLKELEQGLLDSIHQIRLTCNELRPPLLSELGLERALENLFEYTQVSSTFKIVFETDNLNHLSINDEMTIAVYRMIQELLNNAAKHAKATMLNILISKQNMLKIVYTDDGIGFELSNLNQGMGLSSMKQRVRSLNGDIVFYSKPGQGLHVEIVLPVMENERV